MQRRVSFQEDELTTRPTYQYCVKLESAIDQFEEAIRPKGFFKFFYYILQFFGLDEHANIRKEINEAKNKLGTLKQLVIIQENLHRTSLRFPDSLCERHTTTLQKKLATENQLKQLGKQHEEHIAALKRKARSLESFIMSKIQDSQVNAIKSFIRNAQEHDKITAEKTDLLPDKIEKKVHYESRIFKFTRGAREENLKIEENAAKLDDANNRLAILNKQASFLDKEYDDEIQRARDQIQAITKEIEKSSSQHSSAYASAQEEFLKAQVEHGEVLAEMNKMEARHYHQIINNETILDFLRSYISFISISKALQEYLPDISSIRQSVGNLFKFFWSSEANDRTGADFYDLYQTKLNNKGQNEFLSGDNTSLLNIVNQQDRIKSRIIKPPLLIIPPSSPQHALATPSNVLIPPPPTAAMPSAPAKPGLSNVLSYSIFKAAGTYQIIKPAKLPIAKFAKQITNFIQRQGSVIKGLSNQPQLQQQQLMLNNALIDLKDAIRKTYRPEFTVESAKFKKAMQLKQSIRDTENENEKQTREHMLLKQKVEQEIVRVNENILQLQTKKTNATLNQLKQEMSIHDDIIEESEGVKLANAANANSCWSWFCCSSSAQEEKQGIARIADLNARQEFLRTQNQGEAYEAKIVQLEKHKQDLEFELETHMQAAPKAITIDILQNDLVEVNASIEHDRKIYHHTLNEETILQALRIYQIIVFSHEELLTLLKKPTDFELDQLKIIEHLQTEFANERNTIELILAQYHFTDPNTQNFGRYKVIFDELDDTKKTAFLQGDFSTSSKLFFSDYVLEKPTTLHLTA